MVLGVCGGGVWYLNLNFSSFCCPTVLKIRKYWTIKTQLSATDQPKGLAHLNTNIWLFVYYYILSLHGCMGKKDRDLLSSLPLSVHSLFWVSCLIFVLPLSGCRIVLLFLGYHLYVSLYMQQKLQHLITGIGLPWCYILFDCPFEFTEIQHFKHKIKNLMLAACLSKIQSSQRRHKHCQYQICIYIWIGYISQYFSLCLWPNKLQF